MISERIVKLGSIPYASTYRQLLRGLLPFASVLGVVDDSGAQPLSDAAISLLNDLEPHLIRVDQVDSWPGTKKLDGKTASRYLFNFNSTVLDRILEDSVGLYDWVPSALPRDLHLLRDDRSPVLTTIAAHRSAWLEFDEDDYGAWCRNNPVEVLHLLDPPVAAGTRVQLLGPLGGTKIGSRMSASDLAPFIGKLPQSLVLPLAEYLRSGTLMLKVPGVTSDELNGRFTVENGADLLTDGSFIWRRDAANYVHDYAIGLPETTLNSLVDRDWTIQALTEDELEALEEQVWADL